MEKREVKEWELAQKRDKNEEEKAARRRGREDRGRNETGTLQARDKPLGRQAIARLLPISIKTLPNTVTRRPLLPPVAIHLRPHLLSPHLYSRPRCCTIPVLFRAALSSHVLKYRHLIPLFSHH